MRRSLRLPTVHYIAMEWRAEIRKRGCDNGAEMTSTIDSDQFPTFPSGLWRRVVLFPQAGWIGGAIEDDFHHFLIRLDHDGTRVTGAQGRALRHPWSACGLAPGHLARELVGARLADVAARDPFQHCTHTFDLAVLCAADALDDAPSVLDMKVADRVDGRTTATLERNGEECLRWLLEGTAIAGPAPFAGRETKKLSQWKSEFSPEVAEWCAMLRRACYVSGGRQHHRPLGPFATHSPLARLKPCFNYQPGNVEQSTPTSERRDFRPGRLEPLMDFAPATAFGELAMARMSD